MQGKIELITGCMGAGKTEELIRRLNRHAIAKRNIILFRPPTDTREFLSRSGLNLLDNIYITNEFKDLPDPIDILSYDVIGIDESQFFDNIDIVNKYADFDKLVILSSVSFHPDLSFFKPMINLYPNIEDITILKAVCMDCGEEASFTVRVNNNSNEVLVGSNQYKAVCRKCRKNYK
jgi:thymidine kinase